MREKIITMSLLTLFSSLIPAQAMDERVMMVEEESKKRTFSEFSNCYLLRRIPVEFYGPPAKRAKTGEWCDLEFDSGDSQDDVLPSYQDTGSCEIEEFDEFMEEEGHFASPIFPDLINPGASLFAHTKSAMFFSQGENFGWGMNRMGCMYPPAW